MNKNALEWTVFGVSLVLILGVTGLLLWQHVTGSNHPPAIVIHAGEPVETAGGFAVPIDVRNDGDLTAEDVLVEATLVWPGGMERGEAVLTLIPYRSARRAWIVFSRDPRTAALQTRVLGYREP